MEWLMAGSVSSSNTSPFGTGQLNRMARAQQRNLDEETEESETDQNREDNPQYRVQPFVEGVSDYDEYQQAWRLLGFMIDCDDTWMNDDNYNGGGGSQDDNDTGLGCARYVIWAAVSSIWFLVALCVVGFRFCTIGYWLIQCINLSLLHFYF